MSFCYRVNLHSLNGPERHLLDSSHLTEEDKKGYKEILTGTAPEITWNNSLRTLSRLLWKHYSEKVVILQIAVPLSNFPRLLKASDKQRKNYILSGGGTGIHWDDIDEDISVQGLLFCTDLYQIFRLLCAAVNPCRMQYSSACAADSRYHGSTADSSGVNTPSTWDESFP